MLDNMDKGKKKKLVVGVIVALFLVSLGSGAIRLGGDELDINRPLLDYSTPTYTVSVLGIPSTLESGDTVSVLLNDLISIDVKVHWTSTRNNPSQIQCKMIDSFYGIFYQDVAWDSVDGNDDYHWNFDLRDLPTGNYAYHFEFIGYYPDQETATSIYSDQSFYFNIDKSAEQIPDAPSIWSEPDNFEMNDETSKQLVWEYQYGTAGTITVSVDDIVDDTHDFNGMTAGQIYRYTYTPTSIGTHTLKFALDPDYAGHSTIFSTVIVTVVSVEDYNLIEGIPNAVDGVAIRMDGQLSVIGWAVSHQWLEDSDEVPADVRNLPKSGNLRITLVGELGGSYTMTSFDNVKMIIKNSGTEQTFDFELQVAVPLISIIIFGVTLESWFEVNIDLAEFEAGEYECEIRCAYSGALYRVSTFTITVNTFPTGWLVANAGFIVLVMVCSIVIVKVIREGRGWFLFAGKYGK